MKKLTIGILAHVDAGKTTLSESVLFLTGNIRKMGRVDHGDAFLDTYALERARGITIFSKQARLKLNQAEISLLDTPGHVDFSAEMERTLQVLDYAILVISGTDGVQGHTRTLMRLLKRYEIPVFLFVNKMDLPGCEKEELMEELRKAFGDGFVDFSNDTEEVFMENIAMCHEDALDIFMECGKIDDGMISELIWKRKVFPCFFGSALKLEGVEQFIQGLERYTKEFSYPAEFGAKVYKIARDTQGTRLTYLKITGGSLGVRQMITYESGQGEKIDQIRLYSGAKYETAECVEAGSICAVTGLSETYPGQGLGIEKESELPVLEPVLTYQILFPAEINVHDMLLKLRELEEEEPELHIVWNEQLKEIHARVMGEIQIEILKSLILERFGISVEFGRGSIVYKETIENTVEGVGHYEPLRHYAEVHLLLEPGERGSGLVFDTVCSEDELAGNWQRLILTHLGEKNHLGVLTGSPVTDMKITLIAGRAHLKHTEGGDFREATYRAVRHGLKMAKSVLLEPFYRFRIEVPTENAGRAMTDIQKMYGSFETPRTDGRTSIITGKAPVSTMHDYARELIAYTKGNGRIFCEMAGYEECHNAEEVLEAYAYDSESDLANPTGSVFCAHGAGFFVPWNEVEGYMHLHPELPGKKDEIEEEVRQDEKRPKKEQNAYVLDKELEEIFERTFGPVKRHSYTDVKRPLTEEKPYVAKWEQKKPVKNYLLVDGYNLLFSWEELNELSKVSLDGARTKLMDILCNYQAYKSMEVILVFDAYKVKGNPGEIMAYHNIHVVYTKEAQ
ncbi:MAG: NYN domain-containing protein, partial [Lachnospiraceae bacterium]|nr:NYN domain-containing protein [Lachnospiraceae bacterium]